MAVSLQEIKRFRTEVFNHYLKHGRSLPWRRTHNPYRILVSEFMLQQTQVDRVIPKYKGFLERFPNLKSLAKADSRVVLKFWQGLGYNRRALNLKRTAEILASCASFPRSVEELEALPGVGPYTARAIAIFAFNRDEISIETNIRAAAIHFFFPKKRKITDREILPVLERALPRGKSRMWHQALMDYGAMIKKGNTNPSRRSAHYVRQSKFEGSRRQLRGLILREYLKGGKIDSRKIAVQSFRKESEVKELLKTLYQEGLVGRPISYRQARGKRKLRKTV